ncbi:hypothetical protein AYI69_g6982 [Smittium culicis]|uniref:Uncharacterized protein n=1 Tax=Smittium culicis TaxID=133412 RepID=A0A1R1XV67_9FUNG|nr:hypothetical protein AYI69_g6982 [Smittium culicis]
MNQEAISQITVNQISITNLTVYPELIQALPSIEDDFFRATLSEEERKEAIHSFPRSSSMHYQPPPLNDSVFAAVKKDDACLHGIQIALAQATRPVDYYVHRIIQDNPSVREDDPHINFSYTMRALLADIASTETQGRLDNLHKGMDLPGKPQQLVDSDTKPLMDQENLDALIASKKPEKRARIRMPIRGRQQSSTRPPDYGRVQGGMRFEHLPNLLQAYRTGVQNQSGEIIHYPEASYYACRDANKFTRNDSESSIIKGQGPTPRSQQVVEYRTDHREGVGDFYRESTGNISGSVSWTINATKTLRTEKTALSTLKSWTAYVPSVLNPADTPSRLTAQTEWSVSDSKFDTLNSQFGPHDVNLFASNLNKKLKTYYSWFPETNDMGVNSLVFSSQTEQTDNNSDNTTKEIGDLVPRPSQPIDFSAATSTSNSGSAQPQKRKFIAIGEQTLESDVWRISGEPSKSKVSQILPLTLSFPTKMWKT